MLGPLKLRSEKRTISDQSNLDIERQRCDQNWLSEAILRYGETELLAVERFETRALILKQPSCFGFEVPTEMLQRIGEPQQTAVQMFVYSNIIIHHGDIYGMGCKPLVTKPRNFVPRNASEISGHIYIGKEIEHDASLLYTTHYSAHNYYHFLIDYISHAQYLKRLPDAAPFVFSKTRETFQQEIAFALCKSNIKIHEFATTYFFKKLAICNTLAKTCVIDFIRSNTQAVIPASLKKRIYITRKDASIRRVVNEEDLLPILGKFGFDIVSNDRMPFDEQVAVYKSAEIVCGPHGAGLANIAFCEEGTAIIEFFLEERMPLSAVFWELGCAGNMPYFMVKGSRVPIETHPWDNEGDLTVEPRDLEAAIQAAINAIAGICP